MKGDETKCYTECGNIGVKRWGAGPMTMIGMIIMCI